MQGSEIFAKEKISKILLRLAPPVMFAQLIQALYNIIDSLFVGRYSETGLTALSIIYPVQLLMIALAVGTGVGINTLMAARMGAGRQQEAEEAAGTGTPLALIIWALFAVFGFFFMPAYARMSTQSEAVIREVILYGRTVCVFSFGLTLESVWTKVLQAEGDMKTPMIAQIAGAAVNIALDPILIFGYFGFPSLGIKGAAIATVAGQIFAMFIGLSFLRKNRHVNIKVFRIRINKDSAKDILEVGVPSIIMQGIGTLMTSLMNAILIAYDVLATTVFGVYFKLQSFVFMPVFGMNSGLMPILGFNYGAKNRARMMKALKLGLVFAFSFMTLCAVVFRFFPDALLGLFNASDEMKAIGEVALRSISITFPLAAISIMMGSLFQAMGNGYISMITSIVRQIFVLIPCAWLFGKLFGLDAVWYAWMAAEVVALIVSVLYFRKELKKLDF